jgi:hypothetical protein
MKLGESAKLTVSASPSSIVILARCLLPWSLLHLFDLHHALGALQTPWTFLSVNTCPSIFKWIRHELENINQNQTATIPISSAVRRLRAMYTSSIFVLRAVHVSAIVWRAFLGFLPNTWKVLFSNTFHWLLLGDFHLATSLVGINSSI